MHTYDMILYKQRQHFFVFFVFGYKLQTQKTRWFSQPVIGTNSKSPLRFQITYLTRVTSLAEGCSNGGWPSRFANKPKTQHLLIATLSPNSVCLPHLMQILSYTLSYSTAHNPIIIFHSPLQTHSSTPSRRRVLFNRRLRLPTRKDLGFYI